MKELYNLLLFIIICFVLYILFRNFNYNIMREGMTDSSGNNIIPPSNGIAGNAASYAALLKSSSIKAEDTLLISKYRADYETAILNLDDLINTQMLTIALNANPSNLMHSIAELSQGQQAKNALNSVMKYVDGK